MDKVRFAVVGIGWYGIGSNHLRAIAHNNNAVAAAICDVNEESMAHWAEMYNVPFCCTDYHELLTGDKIDAVVICLPDQMHRRAVVEFLEAGINVLCEKPLALHNDDCNAIIEAERKSSAKFMIGQICRKTPSFILAKEIVDSGTIGELYFVESEYAHDYSEMNHSWRNDPVNLRHPVTGGGCHAVDLLRWIAGDPTEAYAYSNKKSLGEGWPCDDSSIAMLKFPNNVMGKVYVSTGCKRNATMRTVLYGTKGTIITDNGNNTLSLFVESFEGKQKLFGRGMKTVEMRLPVEINNHNVEAEIAEMIDCLINDKEISIPASEGAATVAVCEAIVASAESGKPEKITYYR